MQRTAITKLSELNPGLRPARLGPLGQVRGRIEYRDLLSVRPGGVTTETIGAAPLDTGMWNVVTLYGLAYQVRTANPHASKQDRKQEIGE